MDSLWVFGYGSLCWLPGFNYGDSVVGHVEGFARRFWQGNASHRGTKEKVSLYVILVMVSISLHVSRRSIRSDVYLTFAHSLLQAVS